MRRYERSPDVAEMPSRTRRRQGVSGEVEEKSGQTETAGGSILLLFFLASLLIPVRIYLGDLLLSPDRIFLLVVFVPLFFRLVGGKAGPIQPVDVMVFLYCVWFGLAMLVYGGADELPFIGITVVEQFGGYLVGRTVVRSQIDYRMFFKYFTYGLIFLLPFVIFEQLTRRLLLSEILGTVFETYRYVNYEQRLGLNWVQAVFEHPILYGLFCSIAIANLYYLNRERLARVIPLTSLAVFMTFNALSSAAILSAVLQAGMIVWDKVTGSKWVLFACLSVIAYVVVDLLSDRSPIEVLISYATLNQGTGFNRILIWRYGTQNIAANPVFGIGLGDWERIWWMKPSVDNFWLLTAMRYGLPAAFFLIGGIVWSFWRIFAARGLSHQENECRNGYAVAAVAFFFTLATAHVWGSTSVLMMFYIGAGVWIAQVGGAVAAEDEPTPATRRATSSPRAAPIDRRAAGPKAESAASTPGNAGPVRIRPARRPPPTRTR